MAEISFYSFLIKSHHLKYRLQCFRPVISNAPAAYFPTVQDDIVLGSQNIAYVLLGHQVFHIFRFWRGKGIMGECPLLRSFGASKCRHLFENLGNGVSCIFFSGYDELTRSIRSFSFVSITSSLSTKLISRSS